MSNKSHELHLFANISFKFSEYSYGLFFHIHVCLISCSCLFDQL